MPRSLPLRRPGRAAFLFGAAILAFGPARAQAPHRLDRQEEVRVDLVLVDIVVQDRHGAPVRGLTREDFVIRIDNTNVPPDRIGSFEEMCPAADPAASPAPAASATGGEAPPVSPATPAPRRIALYFDFSGLTQAGRAASLAAARDFIRRGLEPGDRVMILTRGRSLRVEQDFTDSGVILADRLESLRTDRGDPASGVHEESANIHSIASVDCGRSDVFDCPRRQHLAREMALRERERVLASLEDLARLMPAFEAIRGRKALVLFSDALRRSPGAQYLALARGTPEGEGIRIEDELLALTREANAAGVSIYTVHASGLDDPASSPWRETLNTQTTEVNDPRQAALLGLPLVEHGTTARMTDETLTAARTGLDSALALQVTLAAETGGRALQRTNDLGGIIETARRDLACYYLVGYRHDARADGRSHVIDVALHRDADRRLGRGVSLRHRPYYTDRSESEDRDRLLASALRLPALYRALPIRTEAFALAPQGDGRRVLLKTTLPIEASPPLPASGAAGEDRFEARGEAWIDGKSSWSFRHTFDLPLSPGTQVRSIVHETGGVLRPGDYDLILAILDRATGDVGAERTSLRVPAAAGTAWISEIQLWTRDPANLLVTRGAEAVGLRDDQVIGGQVPLAERRLPRMGSGLLSFFLCLPRDAAPGPERPVRVRRALRGAADAVVADFRPLEITAPPDDPSGCYQFINTIPTDTLGPGVYTFEVRIEGHASGTLARDAAIVVE